MSQNISSSERFQNFLENPNVILDIDQKSDAWYKIRREHLTASRDVASVILPPWLSFKSAWLTLQEKSTRVPQDKLEEDSSSERVNWGNLCEPYAIDIFESHLMPNLKRSPKKIGFVNHPRISFLGCSPDALFFDEDLKEFSLLEVKCPLLGETKDEILQDDVPILHWIQMQIQMECLDVGNCYYLVANFLKYADLASYEADDGHIKGEFNELESYWYLNSSKIILVQRSKVWFAEIEPILYDFWSRVEDAGNPLKRKLIETSDDTPLYLQNWDQKISVTETWNYAHNDPFLDWMRIRGAAEGYKLDTTADDYFEAYDFNLLFRRKYRRFRSTLMTEITHNLEISDDDMDSPSNLLSVDKLEERTRKLMREKALIICNAFLYNPKEGIYGIVDLLVRNDHKIIRVLDPTRKFNPLISPLTYSIIMIKNNDLHLNADGRTLRNVPNQRSVWESCIQSLCVRQSLAL